jgi:hypothetical protein
MMVGVFLVALHMPNPCRAARVPANVTRVVPSNVTRVAPVEPVGRPYSDFVPRALPGGVARLSGERGVQWARCSHPARLR